jgi:DNA-binding CsgD family transcriptional regulator
MRKRADYLNLAGMVKLAVGDYQAALDDFQSALDLSAESGADRLAPLILDNMGRCYGCMGDSVNGLSALRSACSSSPLRADASMYSLTLGHIGTILRRDGFHAEAVSPYEQAAEVGQASEDPYAHLNATANLLHLTGLMNRCTQTGLREISRRAHELNIQFIACKAETLSMILSFIAAGRFEDGLVPVIRKQLAMGHWDFLSQELSLHPKLLARTLDAWRDESSYAVLITVLLRSHRGMKCIAEALAHCGPDTTDRFLTVVESSLDVVVRKELSEGLRERTSPRFRAIASALVADSRAPTSPQNAWSPLTRREDEVMKMIAEGSRNHEIAEKLFVSLATVKTHVNHIFAKLEVKDRVQAILKYRELTGLAENQPKSEGESN